MKILAAVILVFGGWTAAICLAAQCTTVMDARLTADYEEYRARAERMMESRFCAGEVGWLPGASRAEAAARLASGKLVRSNIGDPVLNSRLAGRNGAIIHWIGAVLIPGADLDDFRAVVEDYARYDKTYRPMVFQARATPAASDPAAVYDALLGLHSTFRFASIFPQHYAFQVKARIEYSEPDPDSGISVHLRASEIRESDSGAPGARDLLETGRDHGIMWALNSYWRARRHGSGLYMEFETITLARSVAGFACKIGILPVPKAVIASAMDSLPADSVTVILEGTRAECARRAARKLAGAP